MSAPETPTGVLLSDGEPQTPEWHALRVGGIGSSEVAVLVGLAPGDWDSPRSLYHRKRGELAPKPQTREMRWGTLLEAPIATAWAQGHPAYDVVPTGTWAHRDRPWQRANPDRLLLLDGEVVGVLEVKTGSLHEEGWGEDDSDEIPLHYRCQVMWQMDTLGLASADVAALLDGRHFRSYTIDYDEADAKLLREAAEEFWARVQDGRPPPVDWAAPTTRALKELHPDLEDREVEVPATLARQYASACAATRRAEQRKALAVNRLLERLGNARYAVHGGQRVAIRSVSDRKGYTVAPRAGVVSLIPSRTKESA